MKFVAKSRRDAAELADLLHGAAAVIKECLEEADELSGEMLEEMYIVAGLAMADAHEIRHYLGSLLAKRDRESAPEARA